MAGLRCVCAETPLGITDSGVPDHERQDACCSPAVFHERSPGCLVGRCAQERAELQSGSWGGGAILFATFLESQLETEMELH